MFPAYSKTSPVSESVSPENPSSIGENGVANDTSADPSDWLRNSSFTPVLGKVVFHGDVGADDRKIDRDDDDDDNDDDDEFSAKRRKSDSSEDDGDKKSQRKDKSKKKKKDKKKEKKRAKREYEEYLSRHGGGDFDRKETSHVSKDSTKSSSYNPNINLSRTGAIFLDDMYQLRPEDAFRIDRKCDLNNIVYQSLYVKHVAFYRRLVTTTVGPKSVSLRRKGADKDGKKKSNDGRYFSKENRLKLRLMAKKVTGEGKEAVDVGVSSDKRAEKSDAAEDLSKIPLPRAEANDADSAPKTTVRSATGSIETLGIFDAKTLLYVQGKDSGGKESREDGEVEDDDDEAAEDAGTKTLEQLVKLRVGKLNEDLTARPNDVALWMEMIEYQEEAVPVLLGAMTGSSSKAKTAKTVAKEITEKKQAILDKALLKNSSSLELQLLQFQLQRGLWDEQRWRHAWKRLLFNHANDVDLHLRYLKNFKSTVATFNLTDLLKEFCASFATLRTNKESRNVTKSTSVMTLRMEDQLVLFFLHYVHTLMQAGLLERAIASIQAVIEFNLFRPSKYAGNRLDHDDVVAVMESFWDSSVPRFGEKDAKGWDDYVSMEGRHELPKGTMEGMTSEEMTTEETEIIVDTLVAESKRWWKLEALRCQQQILPWRPNIENGETEDCCEDPERLVIFEDVKPILFAVNEESQFDLILHFLALLGLPSARRFLRKSSSSYHHHQHHSSVVSSFDQVDVGGGVFSTNFLRGSWRHPPSSHDTLRVDHQLRLEMTRNVLETSLKRFRGERKSVLAGLLIETFVSAALRCSNDGVVDPKRLKALKKAVKSNAKELLADPDLRSSPSSLHAWIAYALVEWQLDKPEDARKILDNAAQMFAAAPLSKDTDIESAASEEKACLAVKASLYRIRAELELGCCFVDDEIDAVSTSRGVEENKVDGSAASSPIDSAKTQLLLLIGSTADSGASRDTASLLARKQLASSRDGMFESLSARCLGKNCDCDFECNCNLSGDSIAQICRIVDALFEVVVASSLLEFCISDAEEASKIFQQSANRLRPFFSLPPTREDSFDPLKSEPLFLYERILCHHVKFLAWVRKSGWRLISRNYAATATSSIPFDPTKSYKQLLWQSAQQFPDNAFLTRLFLRSSSSAAYASFHLHRRLNSLVKAASTPTLLFVAFHEFHERFQTAESATSGLWLLNMMRNGTTTNWKHSVLKHSVLLWRQLFRMHLVVSGGRKTERQKDELDARDPVVYLQHQVSPEAAWSFYESLRFCPWAKQIYLDKIKNDFKQWEQVVDMMTEKELRVRFPIEEFKILLENC